MFRPDGTFDFGSESALLKELEALAAQGEELQQDDYEPEIDEQEDEAPHSAIRVEEGVADYGVEHVELTEEDLADPDLLGQLAQMNAVPTANESNHEVHEAIQNESPNVNLDKIHEAIQNESSKVSLDEIQIGGEKGHHEESSMPTRQEPDYDRLNQEELRKLADEHKVQAVMYKRVGDREGMQRAFAIYKEAQSRLDDSAASKVAVSSSSKVKVSEAVKIMEKQLAAAKQSKKKLPSAAMESDLVALRGLALKNAELLVPMVKQVVSLPVILTQPEIPAGEMHVRVGGIRAKREGATMPAELGKQDHFYRLTLDQTDYTGSVVFRAANWAEAKQAQTRFVLRPPEMSGIRAVKFFEHHRLKIELVKRETVFLLKKKETGMGTAYLKLSPLLTAASVEQEVELGGLLVAVKIDLREPLKGANAMQSRDETWLLPQKGLALKAFQGPPDKPPVDNAPKFAYASYVVIEWELEQTKDAKERKKLELQRDRLQQSVEDGSLSLAAYLEQVKKAIEECKRATLMAKRAGNMDECRRLLKHLQLMEEEVSEATG